MGVLAGSALCKGGEGREGSEARLVFQRYSEVGQPRGMAKTMDGDCPRQGFTGGCP